MSNQVTRVRSPPRVANTGYGRPWSPGYGRPHSPGYGRPWSPGYGRPWPPGYGRRGYYAPPIYAPPIYAPPIIASGYGYPYGGYGYPYSYVNPAALPVLAATNAVAGLANLAAAATYY